MAEIKGTDWEDAGTHLVCGSKVIKGFGMYACTGACNKDARDIGKVIPEREVKKAGGGG